MSSVNRGEIQRCVWEIQATNLVLDGRQMKMLLYYRKGVCVEIFSQKEKYKNPTKNPNYT